MEALVLTDINDSRILSKLDTYKSPFEHSEDRIYEFPRTSYNKFDYALTCSSL